MGAAVGSNMGETVLSEAVGEVVADWVDDVYELNGRSQCADAWMRWVERDGAGAACKERRRMSNNSKLPEVPHSLQVSGVSCC